MVLMTSLRPDHAAVVELARHAPSVHNTQPWHFEDDHGVLTLRRDETRRLPVLDPDARQQTLSCGAALFLARLGLRLQGFEPVVEMARPSDAPILARLRALPGRDVTAQDVALEHAARSRHMQRGRFEDRKVENDAVVAMRGAAQQAGAWVRFLTGTSEQLAVAVLVAHADDQESSDESYQQELAEWTTRPSEARDGLVAAAVDLGGLPGPATSGCATSPGLRSTPSGPAVTKRPWSSNLWSPSSARPGTGRATGSWRARRCARSCCRPRSAGCRPHPSGRSSIGRGRVVGWPASSDW